MDLQQLFQLPALERFDSVMNLAVIERGIIWFRVKVSILDGYTLIGYEHGSPIETQFIVQKDGPVTLTISNGLEQFEVRLQALKQENGQFTLSASMHQVTEA